jgi:transcriptional regulator with XRE-family HTH domain
MVTLRPPLSTVLDLFLASSRSVLYHCAKRSLVLPPSSVLGCSCPVFEVTAKWPFSDLAPRQSHNYHEDMRKTNNEPTLAQRIQQQRRRRGLSQAELAEASGVSAKTIQRLETGMSIAMSNQRMVLAALELDPGEVDLGVDESTIQESPWTVVESARTFLSELAMSREVQVELDRDGWRQARRARPWYRQDVVFASHDPTELILDIVDRAKEISSHAPGQAAKERDALSESMRAARILGWELASRVDAAGCLHLYIGSPTEVAGRVAA